MTEVKLKLNCKKTTCYKCRLIHYHMMWGETCFYFFKKLQKKGRSLLRLKECMELEKQ